jgi:transposase
MSKKEDACGKLFCRFSLSDRVPQNHLLRQVRRVIDHEAIRLGDWASPTTAAQECPSVDPAVVLKMALLGYCVIQ